MFPKSMQWLSITALLLSVIWPYSTNNHLTQGLAAFVVAALGVLVIYFSIREHFLPIKARIEFHYAVAGGANPLRRGNLESSAK